MALTFNKTNIITSDDKIMRDVSYVFLRPHFNKKYSTEVQCDFFEETSDENIKLFKYTVIFEIDVNLTTENLILVMHNLIIDKIIELKPNLVITISEI